MKSYNHKSVEAKWQKKWEKDGLYQAKNDSKKPKFYSLIEFPYPSGDGLHVGHIRSNTAMDVISRKRRMEGFEVLYPIGWDAFGLPTENYAIKTGIHPIKVTKQNTDNFRKQLKALGFSFDWSREINTSDPLYYKWTQWIFLQFFKKGLAYKKKMAINWCPKDKIGLANEEVIDGKCERCGTEVEKREKEQWMLAITKYADRLDKDLDEVNFQERIKIQQRNWIGKSEGSLIKFPISESEESIEVFTTRPDTLFGATYMVLAPENPLVESLKARISNWDDVSKYIFKSKQKNEIERTSTGKEKTGVELKRVKAINPVNNKEVPIWIADYVLADYGTGAIMAVPAHDERDYEFAKKHNIEIIQVIDSGGLDLPYLGNGKLINSQKFNDLESNSAKEGITDMAGGKLVTTYKLRDWVFSRQRYWGEPIPLVNCEKCGWVAVPEKDLPVELPEVKNYEPTDTGESPLATITSWVKTKCPQCGSEAKRETDTMPNWAGSSWYYLRYIDPKNTGSFADIKNLKKWLPVDWYNGGMEHTTLHLLYSRFWHKFLYDLKLVSTKEPYEKRTSHGLILAKGGVKMSKSKGNVINPDTIIERFGADSLRLYEMFMGPFEQAISWSEDGVVGTRRFIEKVWRLKEKVGDEKESEEVSILLNQTIKKVSEDIESMKFNTAVSQLMITANELDKIPSINKETFETYIKLLSPFAPHVAEEFWSLMGNKGSVHTTDWPAYDKDKLVVNTIQIAVQINSKIRGSISTNVGATEEEVVKLAMLDPQIKKWVPGEKIKKIIYIKNKILSIVA